MKKLFTTLLFAASLSLSACGEASMSSGSMKSNLEGKGYVAEVMGKEEAELRIKGINYVVNITDAVYSGKDKEVLVAFFCANIDDATKFVQENIQAMHNYASQFSEDPKVGSHNNVAYTGTYNILSAAGIPVTK